jgi:hypothetical protein
MYHTHGQPPQVIMPEQGRKSGGWLRFDLRAASDTIRTSVESVIRVELEIEQPAGRSARILLARIERDRSSLSQVTIERGHDGWLVAAAWHGGAGMRGRCLRIWPLWRPWDAPSMLSIADDACERAEWRLSDETIRVGQYLAEIGVDDGWTTTPVRRPSPEAPDTVLVTIGSPTEQDEYLGQLQPSVTSYFEQLLASPDDECRRQHICQIERAWSNYDIDVALDVLLLQLERDPLRAFFVDTGWRARLLGLLRRDPQMLWSAVAQRGANLSPAFRQLLEDVLRTLGTLYLVGIERRAHTAAIRGVALSQDGRLLATSDEEGKIKIWQTVRGLLTIQHTLTGHNGYVACVALSPDGKLLASVGADGTIRIWDVATGTAVRVIRPSSVPVLHVAFSDNGTHLVACGMSRHVGIWRVADGHQIWSAAAATSEVWQVAFSPNRKWLAAATGRGVQLWSLHDGASRLLETARGAHSIAFRSPDGGLLAAGCTDGSIRRWLLSEETALPLILTKHGVVHTIAFRSDGQSLAAGYGNGAIALWRMCAGELIQHVNPPGHAITCLAFSADGQSLVAGDADGTLKSFSSVPRW